MFGGRGRWIRTGAALLGVTVVAIAAGLYVINTREKVIFSHAKIEPSTAQICEGDTQDFSVKVYDKDDAEVGVGGGGIWKFVPDTIASADKGTVTALAPGTTILTVEFPSANLDPIQASITVGPYDASTACAAAGSPYCGNVDAGCGNTVSCGICEEDRSAETGCTLSGRYVATLSCECGGTCPGGSCGCYRTARCGQVASENCLSGADPATGYPTVIPGPDVPTLRDFFPTAPESQNNCTCQ
jgi:hypothetical protein